MRRMMLPKARHGAFTVHELLNSHNDLTRAWGVFTVPRDGVCCGIEICVHEAATLEAAERWALAGGAK